MFLDLNRLLEGPHTIDRKSIAVAKQTPKKKVPLDPMKIDVQGLDETTSEDCLCFYLEKFTKVEVAEVFKGYNNNALAIFDDEPGDCQMLRQCVAHQCAFIERTSNNNMIPKLSITRLS